LDYVKVPTPTQYSTWSDEQQTKADQMKGVRYYLPRPFVNLKQSVPVAQRVAFIAFNYDPATGEYKLDLPGDAPTWVKRIAPAKLSVAQAIAAMVVGLTNAAKAAGSGNLQAGTTDTNVPSSAATQTNTPPTPEPPAQTLSASTGYINDTDPVTKLGSILDVVYLPDMEEQYVIQAHTGFAGQADIETRLRNGWAAETFKQKVDNSQLIPYVIRQFQSASDTAAKIATTWLPTAAFGLPPNTSLADMMKFVSKGAGGLQSGTTGDTNAPTINARDFLGKALLFKIAEVRVGQPGLYPILKPREIRQWFKPTGVIGGGDPELNFETFIQQANVPWIRPDMAFIPCPPFTVVGFNSTIDVFMMPATERVGIATPADDSTPKNKPIENSNEVEKMKKQVHDVFLAAAKSSTVPELKELTDQGVVVSPDNNATKIRCGIAGSQFKPGFDYVTFVASALKVKSEDTKALVSTDSSSLTITIQEPLSQITQGLPK
jgi:hypothetical protein